MKDIIGLQYLRGLAALLVVIYHMVPRFVKDAVPPFGWEWMAGGVDVFFVISGYIIWLTTEKPGVRPWPWWRSRLIRIVPLYWIGTVTVIGALALRESYVPSVEQLVKSFLFIPMEHWRDEDFAPLLSVGWTLYYEFFFYAVMGLLLFLPHKFVRLGVLCALFFTLVGLRSVADETDAIQFRYTSPLLLEFVAGIFIALVSRHIAPWRSRHLIGAASLAAAVLLLVFVSPQFYPRPRILQLGVPAAFFVFGVVCFEDVLRRRVIGPLKLLGDASYSLYLSHTMVLWLGTWLFFDVFGFEGEGWRFAFRLPLCLAVGVLVYLMIERPLLRRMKGTPTERQPAVGEPAPVLAATERLA